MNAIDDDDRLRDIERGLRDPVCGMRTDPANPRHTVTHGGRTYHFCSTGCGEKFRSAPERYLGAAPPAPSKAAPDAVYTCPMHPEVQQIGPGSCPRCGMALEPMTPTAAADDDRELRAMARRWWVLAALTLPVFLLAM